MRSAEFGMRNFPAMKNNDLKQRTKAFALRVISMSEALPKKMTADVLGRQIVRSATSVAANYRSACRGKSRADFIAKMGIVEEEADESCLWLELITEAALHTEASELTAIAVASIRTARSSRSIPQSTLRTPH